MSDSDGIGKITSGDLLTKWVIVIFVFPILTAALHVLFVVPALMLGALILRLGGTAKFWGTLLSVVALLFAGLGAIWICRMIWPRTKPELSK
jgi:hypothetical protein